MSDNVKIAASNRKAFHDYFVEERFEAGIELCGTEVKSIRMGTVNLKDSYLSVSSECELFAKGIHISPYEKGNIFNRNPLRERKLLMHKKEILKLRSYSEKEGFTLIPLSLYFKNGRVKVEVGVCRGKKLYDKRESALKRDLQRENQRGIKLADRD